MIPDPLFSMFEERRGAIRRRYGRRFYQRLIDGKVGWRKMMHVLHFIGKVRMNRARDKAEEGR